MRLPDEMPIVIDPELTDQNNQPWRLGDALRGSPLVLVFYRGDW